MKRISLLFALGAIALFVITSLGCIERKPERLTKKESPVSGELASMIRESEAIKQDPKTSPEVRRATALRHHEAVYQLMAQSLLIEPLDLYRAALLLQDTTSPACSETWLLAHYMAADAGRRGQDSAKYLAACSYDRYLLSRGLPQKYATQVEKDHFGRWYIPYFDTMTSDSERAVWEVPPLTSLKAAAAAKNH